MREALNADVGVINGGGIRGDRVIPPGPLTRRDLYELLPFSNTVMKVELTGAALRQALEHGLAQADNQGGGFLQVSGLHVTYDGRRAAGSRIIGLEIGGRPSTRTAATRWRCRLRGARRRRPARLPRRACARGADSAPDLATLVLRAIETRKTIAPRVDGRIRAVAPRSSLARRVY